MNDLNKKAFTGLARMAISLAVLLFLPAWTLDYWQAWLFLSVFFTSILLITLYVMQNDPMLLERRLNAGPGAEKEKSQKVIQSFASISFIAAIVFPVIDHRLAWSRVTPYVSLAGDIWVALGLLVVFLVFRENTFTSAVIEVAAEQRVISTGPYAIVRHPMYLGALIMFLGTPLALGSWWGLLAAIPLTSVLVWRLLDEERFLSKSLPGYSEYQNKIPHRLVPFIW